MAIGSGKYTRAELDALVEQYKVTQWDYWIEAGMSWRRENPRPMTKSSTRPVFYDEINELAD